ncbi:MAG TPA: cysteine--tRNA ligase [bacterium]|nr:cysteine--tRNA ligase [bacterium]
MSLKIYNVLAHKKEEFQPLTPGKVKMYVCGITPYDECHLGHARAAVVFDVIFRYLKYAGYEVTYVRNYTDVDDKIIKRANETGQKWSDISKKYIASYQAAMEKLGVQTPSQEPLCTENIPAMTELIQRLMDRGLAYVSGADVLYRVRKFGGYGRLSGKRLDELEAGARIEVDEKKEDPLDFALWKGAKPGEPSWDSPWGKGRPGWHIECSAMSMKILGEQFDIHGGGRDLAFPHHENEIAQSEGATGKDPFARFWIHNGFVNINAEKMSKSLGNFRSIPAILEQWDPEVVRYFLLSAHYASPLDFTEDAMTNAREALARVYETLARFYDAPEGPDAGPILEADEILREGMDDDFNTTVVLGRLFDTVRELNKFLDQGKKPSVDAKASLWSELRKIAETTGLFGSQPKEFLERQKKIGLKTAAISEEEILKLIEDRKAARKAKDFKRSDAIRDELSSKGVRIKDNPDGTTSWEIKG